MIEILKDRVKKDIFKLSYSPVPESVVSDEEKEEGQISFN